MMTEHKPVLLSVAPIWDRAEHNGMTDLIFFGGRFLCCFREGTDHAGGRDGQIRIIASADGKEWKSIALIALEGVDLRDPMLSQMPDGRLLLTMGGSIYVKRKLETCYPRVAFSLNGIDWSPVEQLDKPGEWIWRVTWDKGVGYGASYGSSKNSLRLYKTTDGLDYTFITEMNVTRFPSEATLRFLEDRTMIALVRRRGPAWIGVSQPPYVKWKWNKSACRIGGPNFLILENGMWACGRLYVGNIKKLKELKTFTALYKMSLNSLDPVLEFPSSGDTSYPGMVYRDGLLYISYYSSHEEKTKIYFAVVNSHTV